MNPEPQHAGIGVEPAAAPSHRFTVDGHESLERRVAQICRQVRTALLRVLPARRVEAILLGGGYGRGEGGVRHGAAGDVPYNDLEFYVCLRGGVIWNELLHHRALALVERELSAGAGADVEFKITSLAQLRRRPVTMFSYDLVCGHHWVAGHEGLLAGTEHHRRAEDIPPSEAARLLMNRCTGLLLARERLHRGAATPPDLDFIARNLAKAQLALGDAILALHRRYHWSCRERHRRLAGLDPASAPPRFAELCAHHARGVEFKLHPAPPPSDAGALGPALDEVSALARDVWLWVESRRLGRPYRCPVDYARCPADKFPEMASWRNRLVNARHFGLGALWRGAAARYPRERLLAALPVLLWAPAALADGGVRRHVSERLLAPGDGVGDLVDAYNRLWRRFR